MTRIPADDSKFAVSSNGGVQPHFSPDGKTIFYLALDGKMMAVSVSLGESADIGIPRPLFATTLLPTWSVDEYAVSRDGKRFLVGVPMEQHRQEMLNLLVNWPALDPALKNPEPAGR